jgi:hypothetical protein
MLLFTCRHVGGLVDREMCRWMYVIEYNISHSETLYSYKAFILLPQRVKLHIQSQQLYYMFRDVKVDVELCNVMRHVMAVSECRYRCTEFAVSQIFFRNIL